MPTQWTIGTVVADRYHVLAVHGDGGTGLVHRVRHLGWGVDLAVKSPRPELLRTDDDRQRFIAEADTWVSLGPHPHVCGCHYVRVLDGVPRVFAEYMTGGSLGNRIDDRTLYAGPADDVRSRVLDIAVQAAWGLQHAHDQNLVHQDVKPANILLDGDGTAKITDFGLARARAAVSDDASILVTSGGLTVAYASPEQWERKPLGRRTDVFSLAVSILEMYTGGVSWRFGPAAGHALAAHLRQPAADPRLPVLDAPVAHLLQRCLHDDPQLRPAAMTDVADALVAAYEQTFHRPYPRQRPRPADLRADELNNRALSLIDLGRHAEAARMFDRALDVDPEHRPAAYNRTMLRWQRGEVLDEHVVEFVTRIAEASAPDLPSGDRMLADLHLQRGDVEPARSSLVAALRASPGDPDLTSLLDRLGSGEFGAADAAVAIDARIGRVAQARFTADGESLRLVLDPTKACARPMLEWNVHSGRILWAGAFHPELETALSRRLPTDGHGPGRVDGWEIAPGAIDFSADRRTAVTGAVGGEIRVWDLATRRLRHVRNEHGAPVFAVRVSPDGRFAVSGAENGGVWLWDLASGKGLCVRTDSQSERPPRMEGRTTVQGEPIRVTQADLMRQMLGLDQKLPHVAAVAVSLDAGRVVFVDQRLDSGNPAPAHLQVWDRAADAVTLRIPVDASTVAALAVSPDATFIAVGHTNGDVILCTPDADGGATALRQAHTSPVRAVEQWNNGALVVTGDTFGTVRLFNGRTGQCLRTVELTGGDGIESVAITSDGRHFVSATTREVRYWNVPRGHRAPMVYCRPRSHAELVAHTNQVSDLLDAADRELGQSRFPPALETLRQARATLGRERTADVLDAWARMGRHAIRTGVTSARDRPPLTGHLTNTTDLALGDAAGLAMSAAEDGSIRLWDLSSGRNLWEAYTRQGRSTDQTAYFRPVENSWRMGADLSRDGRTLVAFGANMKLRRWLLSEGDLPVEQPLIEGLEVVIPMHLPPRVRLSSNGARAIVQGERGGTVQVVDFAAEAHRTGLPGAKLKGTFASTARLACISGDGRLACAAMGTTVRLWDADRRDRIGEIRVRAEVDGLTMNRDGSRVLSTGADTPAKLWDLPTGQCLQELDAGGHHQSGPAFSPDGRFAATVVGQHEIWLWRLADGQRVASLPLGGRAGRRIGFTSDSRYLLATTAGPTIPVWELDWTLEAVEAADWVADADRVLLGFLGEGGDPTSASAAEVLQNRLADAGYGWLRSDAVRTALRRVTTDRPVAPPLPRP